MAASGLSGSYAPFKRRRFTTILITLLLSIAFVSLASSALLAHYRVDYYVTSPWRYVPAVAPKLEDPKVTPPPHIAPLDTFLHPENHVHRAPETQFHRWSITKGVRRPDGVAKEVYLINNQFPGPTIEARSGDKLVIEVQNNLPDDGVAFHWHGIFLRGNNTEDGVDGITQCPIKQGKSFIYQFDLDKEQHGTFWYYSTVETQRADGLFGGLIIHKPIETADDEALNRAQYDEERLLMIGDWYHEPARNALAWFRTPDSFAMAPVPDSLLINGHGMYNCSMSMAAQATDCAPVAKPPSLSFDASKKYRLRLINTGAMAGITVRLHRAFMTPIQQDGGIEIEGVASRAVGPLQAGQRSDVVIAWSTENKRSQVELELSFEENAFEHQNPLLAPEHTFQVNLSNVDSHAQVNKAAVHEDMPDLFDLQDAVAPTKQHLPTHANLTLLFYTKTSQVAQFGNIPFSFFNETSWHAPYTPIISLPRSGWDERQLVPFIPLWPEWEKYFGIPTLTSTALPPTVTALRPVLPALTFISLWVDIIVNNQDPIGHPYHLHGHNFYVLQVHSAPASAVANGTYNPFAPTGRNTTTEPFAEPPGGPLNLENPAMRDTVFVPAHGYAVLRFRADNPGMWPFQCHSLWHQAQGMSTTFQVGGDMETGFLKSEWRNVIGKIISVQQSCAP